MKFVLTFVLAEDLFKKKNLILNSSKDLEQLLF